MEEERVVEDSLDELFRIFDLLQTDVLNGWLETK